MPPCLSYTATMICGVVAGHKLRLNLIVVTAFTCVSAYVGVVLTPPASYVLAVLALIPETHQLVLTTVNSSFITTFILGLINLLSGFTHQTTVIYFFFFFLFVSSISTLLSIVGDVSGNRPCPCMYIQQ